MAESSCRVSLRITSCRGGAALSPDSREQGRLMGVTRELAATWGGAGIRVNAIAPGFFHSRLADAVIEHERGVHSSPIRYHGSARPEN